MRTDQSRFDRVREHPDFASAPEQPVLPADSGFGIAEVVGPMVITTFGIVFVLIAITMLVHMQAPLLFTLAFIGIAVMIIRAGTRQSAQLVSYRNAPIERMIAVVVKDRTDVSGGGEHSRASTSYYTTLQTRDGQRAEFHTYASLVGRLAIDDIGVAYVKARTLVEFIRFDVT
ncbi:MAG: DUF2500 family protein [Kofleriaceae bacterium]